VNNNEFLNMTLSSISESVENTVAEEHGQFVLHWYTTTALLASHENAVESARTLPGWPTKEK